MKIKKYYSILIFTIIVFGVTSTANAAEAGDKNESIEMDERAKVIEHDQALFLDDPSYEEKEYNINDQLDIYGAKRAVENPRPLLELGRPIYESGPLQKGSNVFGRKNPTVNQFAVYGDWRNSLAFNDNAGTEKGLLATRLNLDVDYKITATERLHAFLRPLDRAGQFTRCELFGNDEDGCSVEANLNLDALFFEGDLGAISSGILDDYVSWDLPFAVGLMPLLFQNGIWVEDAFTGAAFTLPALNSPSLDISNMDITFFAGFDKVTTAGIVDSSNSSEDDINLYGVTAFIEANRGYWELGYGFVDAQDALDDQDYHNATISFTKRYSNVLSNSIRFVGNFGQDSSSAQNADGYVILVENSFITSKPSTFIPYLNLFFGSDRPQSLARAADAGGILKNTGVNFETDGLTGFPKLDDTANNTWGGALGLEYLFGLDQQLVVEFATVQTYGKERVINRGEEYAIGLRYQKPLDEKWIVRFDAMKGFIEESDDVQGVRFEIRRKF